jgi:hypothetical protein
MKLSSFEIVVRALNAAGVRFLVVGGVAVNAHGYLRATADVDLVIDLSDGNIVATFGALANVSYHPALPVKAVEFANPLLREQWRREKQMLVLKFWSDAHPETPIDIFIHAPFDFEEEYARAFQTNDPDFVPARFAAIPALIAMKESTGRDRDRSDVEKLRQILSLQEDAG